MAREKPPLTRPSLQSDGHAALGYARAAEHGCAQGIPGACGGIRASSRNCAYATRVVPALDCPGSRGRFGAFAAAKAAGARAGTPMRHNRVAWGLGGGTGMVCHTLHIACSPTLKNAPYTKSARSVRERLGDFNLVAIGDLTCWESRIPAALQMARPFSLSVDFTRGPWQAAATEISVPALYGAHVPPEPDSGTMSPATPPPFRHPEPPCSTS